MNDFNNRKYDGTLGNDVLIPLGIELSHKQNALNVNDRKWNLKI